MLKGHYSIFMYNDHSFINSFNFGISIIISHVSDAKYTYIRDREKKKQILVFLRCIK